MYGRRAAGLEFGQARLLFGNLGNKCTVYVPMQAESGELVFASDLGIPVD